MNFALAAQHRCGAGDYVVALDTARGRVAAAASRKGSGYVEVLTNELQAVRRLEVAASTLACFEDTVVTCSQDGSVKLWDLRAKGQARTLQESLEEPAASVAVADGICACAVGASVLLLDTSSGEEIANFEDVHSKPVACVRFHPSILANLVTGGDDGLLCVLDTERMPTEDEALRLAMNSEESVERFSFAADGGLLCSISTSDVLQLWSLNPPREGQRCGRLERLKSEARVQVGESGGHLVDVLYDNQSGAAYVLVSSVKGTVCVYHLNLEGASYMSDLTDAKGGHKSLVRASSRFAEKSFITGGEDGYLCLWREPVQRPSANEAHEIHQWEHGDLAGDVR